MQKKTKPRMFLIYNPRGVVEGDIFLSAKRSEYETESYSIQVGATGEGHTTERIDLLEVAFRIIRFKPSFVLTINGSGLDNNGLLASFCAYIRVPLVLWYVDEPFIIPEWGRKFVPETTIAFTFDRFYKKRLKAWGIPWVYTLPLAANVDRLEAYEESKGEVKPFPNGVSFVGGSDRVKIEYLVRNIASAWPAAPEGWRTFLSEVISRYRQNPMKDTQEIIDECAKDWSFAPQFPNGIVKQMVLSLIDREASFQLRRDILETLRPFHLSVFGDPFWKEVVGEGHYGGAINYYSNDIARLYRSSAINLNISKYQLKTTVNQRLFDCPVCDGFLMTDFREDIEDYFTIDQSVVVYSDLKDLKKKLAIYWENRRRAERIVENAKETVLSRHTYQHRLDMISEVVGEVVKTHRFELECMRVSDSKLPTNFLTFLSRLGMSDGAGGEEAAWELSKTRNGRGDERPQHAD